MTLHTQAAGLHTLLSFPEPYFLTFKVRLAYPPSQLNGAVTQDFLQSQPVRWAWLSRALSENHIVSSPTATSRYALLTLKWCPHLMTSLQLMAFGSLRGLKQCLRQGLKCQSNVNQNSLALHPQASTPRRAPPCGGRFHLLLCLSLWTQGRGKGIIKTLAELYLTGV